MKKAKVVVMNTSKEITEVLTEIFCMEGYDVVSEFTYIYKGDEKQFDQFVLDHQPDVVVYDIAIPYDENYSLFLKLSARQSAGNIPFVLTTTNKNALEKLVGETGSYEIVGKPYDLKLIVDAVKRALHKKVPPPPKLPV